MTADVEMKTFVSGAGNSADVNRIGFKNGDADFVLRQKISGSKTGWSGADYDYVRFHKSSKPNFPCKIPMYQLRLSPAALTNVIAVTALARPSHERRGRLKIMQSASMISGCRQIHNGACFPSSRRRRRDGEEIENEGCEINGMRTERLV